MKIFALTILFSLIIKLRFPKLISLLQKYHLQDVGGPLLELLHVPLHSPGHGAEPFHQQRDTARTVQGTNRPR